MIHVQKDLIVFKILLLLIIFMLAACSPEPVLRLEAVQEDHAVYQGMAYLQSDLDYSTAILAYYRHIDDILVMDIEMINYSESTYRVDPSEITFTAYKYQAEEEKNVIKSGYAVNPEEKLLAIDKQKSKDMARENTRLVLDGVSAGLALASDIASIAGDEPPEARIERLQDRKEQAISRSIRREQFYHRISDLNEQRSHWETNVLRKTDLIPGESIAGELIFPVVRDADYIEIHVPMNDEVHLFEYFQFSYTP